ncbi:ATP-binding protein [Actinoallomurus iriomotensis]|nr:ATP-binding protein [Actinoallomurus iriomotensis]
MDVLNAPADEWLPSGIEPGRLRVYAADAAQVREARRFAVKWLYLITNPQAGDDAQLRAQHHLIDRVQEVVSELATNAVRHAARGDDDQFAVCLSVARGVARVDVMDHSPDAPVVHSAGDLDVMTESGRGMLLVAALSDGWEYEVREVGGRVVKVVRAGFHIPAEIRTNT